jgi:hypothetical protein
MRCFILAAYDHYRTVTKGFDRTHLSTTACFSPPPNHRLIPPMRNLYTPGNTHPSSLIPPFHLFQVTRPPFPFPFPLIDTPVIDPDAIPVLAVAPVLAVPARECLVDGEAWETMAPRREEMRAGVHLGGGKTRDMRSGTG